MATKKIRKDGVIQSESEEEKTKRLPSKKGVKQTEVRICVQKLPPYRR